MKEPTPSLQIFNNPEFGDIRTVTINDKPYFCGNDVAKALGYVKPNNAILQHCRATLKQGIPISGKIQEVNFIPEGDIYRLITKSKLPAAEKFESWVMDEILPTIRKTGGYVHNEEVFVNTYLPFADENTKQLFRTTLHTITEQNRLIEEQKKELKYQGDVIEGLVEDIALADKRQILNRVMRHKVKEGDYTSRWNVLYREFDNKYHMNTKLRLERHNETAKKKLKSRIEYIDKQLDMISELYDIAAKLFHEEVESLVDEMYSLRSQTC